MVYFNTLLSIFLSPVFTSAAYFQKHTSDTIEANNMDPDHTAPLGAV